MPTIKIHWIGLKHHTLRGACFRESPVNRLYSEIGQIHLSSESECGTPVYLWVTATVSVLPYDFLPVGSHERVLVDGVIGVGLVV